MELFIKMDELLSRVQDGQHNGVCEFNETREGCGRIDPEPLTSNGIGYSRKYWVDQRSVLRTIRWLQSIWVLGS